MDRNDRFLLQVLSGCPPLTPREACALEGQWRIERGAHEGLAAYLVRKGILRADSSATVGLMQHGQVAFSNASHLFAPAGVHRVRTWTMGPSVTSQTHNGAGVDSGLSAALARTERRAVVQRMTSLPDFDLADRQASPKPGDILGNCLLTAEIGRGGSGMVFQAYHQGLGVSVAVKVLQLDESRNDPLIHKQLQVEARLLAQLDHPHIVRVLDYENDAPWPYLVLEFVEGPSLSDLIQQSGRLRWDRAVRIVDQVASALEAAQRIGVIHRDVKPGNILLTRSGNAKLADLGLAVIIDEQASRVATRSTARQETLAGTVGYMAPEQALGLPQIDHRADIYGLGCTLYHAITGQLPFRGRTRREVVQKHAHEVPAAPRDLVTELDPALSSLVLKMISKDPKARHASYAELRADLARLPAAAEGDLPPPGEQGAPRQSFWHRLILRLKP